MVLIQFPDGEFGEVSISPSQTVSSLKSSIARQYDSSHITSKLTHDDKPLEDEKSLEYYNITDDSLIVAQMQIYVYFLKKKGFMMDVDPDMYVGEVKAMIESTLSNDEKYTIQNQRLIYEGHNLDNQMSIHRYGINDGANIFVHVREENQSLPPPQGHVPIYIQFGSKKGEEEILTVDVRLRDSVGDVKRKLTMVKNDTLLKELAKLSYASTLLDRMRLSFGGKYLEDDSKTLLDCGISRECLLYLILNQGDSSWTAAHYAEVDRRGRDLGQSKYEEPDEIELVMSQAGCSRDKAVAALEESDGDLITAIISLTSRSKEATATEQKTAAPPSRRKSEEEGVPEQDIELCMSQAGCSRARAVAALKKNDGDLVDAIMSIEGSSSDEEEIDEEEAAPQATNAGTQQSQMNGGGENKIKVYLMDQIGQSEEFTIDPDKTPLSEIFQQYARRKFIPLDSLQFVFGELGELPGECELPAAMLGIQNDDTILAMRTGGGGEQETIGLASVGTSQDDRITLLLKDMHGQQTRVVINSKTTRLDQVFQAYANKVGVPLQHLHFMYETLGELPSNCEATASELGIINEDEILVGRSSGIPQHQNRPVSMASTTSSLNNQLRRIDLTTHKVGETAIISLKEPGGEQVEFKIETKTTSLPFVFLAFAQQRNLVLDSLQFVHGARRLSYDSEETAYENGIEEDESVIYALPRKGYNDSSSAAVTASEDSKINIWLLDIVTNQKEFFRVDSKFPLRKCFNAYAQRRKVSLKSLRFLYGEKVLYADVYSNDKSSDIGVREGDTVYVLTKSNKRSSNGGKKDIPLTPKAIKTMYNIAAAGDDSQGKIFEPIVQVLDVENKSDNMTITISDGKHSLSLHCHPRVKDLFDSKVLSKNAIIHISDFSVATSNRSKKVFDLLDVNETAPNPGKVIGDLSSIQNLNKGFALLQAKEVLAKNIIADFVWRSCERAKAKKHHATKVIVGLIWSVIALQRRRKLRASATLIQKVQRGCSIRNIYFDTVQKRIEDYRQFISIWKNAINQLPSSEQALSGWSLVREKIDLKQVDVLDDDGNLAETDEKLNQALKVALQENNDEIDTFDEEIEEDIEADVGNEPASSNGTTTLVDWSQFQVSVHVVKFIKNGDTKYREMFVKRMRQLAKGERSHKLMKPLKGCESIIYESYLENKGGGFRILWTQEGETIVVWFIAKHKSVSRLAKLIDDAKNRTARQQLPQTFVSELESDPTLQSTPTREVMLDALGNVPLKLYDVNFDSIDDIANKSWTPQMHLTEEERQVVEAKGTVLLLGRSGTGKTICISNRIEYDRQRLGHKPNFSQLFVSRSSRLCIYVEGAIGRNESSTFTTFEKLVNQIDSSLSHGSRASFAQRNHVDFSRFRRDFYAEYDPQEKVSSLIVWKAIRTFLKGSIEAFQTPAGTLERDYFLSGKLGKNRCKLSSDLLGPIFDTFIQYQQWLKEHGLWDDCDRIRSILKRMEEAKKAGFESFEDIKKSKVYVDEVQDYLQIEILLFFYIGKGPGALFLAGDPAQSVVEGTDFRFEEIRSVGYFVAGDGKRHLIPEKPKVVNVNFRSHAGVLNCAGGFLDLLFGYFRNSVKQLKKDHGLFKGARPGVFPQVHTQQLAALLRENLQGAVVLTHDDSASYWKEALGHELVYGIREAKGLEFKTVIILDFFAELPSSLQKPWRNLLLNREGADFEIRYPLVETHLKLVYTAVTRCIEQLFFAETKSSIAGDAAVRWLTTSMHKKELSNSDALATINNVRDLESMAMTNDEWCIVGIDNAEIAESSEVDVEQAISYLNRAIYCFEKAQSTDLVAKAQTHMISVQTRSMISSRPEDGVEKLEVDAANVIEKLLKENLLLECLNLLNSSMPLLPSYTQEKLEEKVISKMHNN